MKRISAERTFTTRLASSARHLLSIFALVSLALAAFPVGAFATDEEAAEDAHFVQSDDYFISDKALGNNAWMWVKLAKMVTPPSKQTKNEAQFFTVTDGRKVWTKYYWKSRIAEPPAVKQGAVVIVPHWSEGEIYHTPENKEDARTGDWWMAKITDTSDLYKGYVTTSFDGNKVKPEALRVLEK